MKSLFLMVLVCFPFLQKTHAQDVSPYEKHQFQQDGQSMPYRILLPKNYDPNKVYPLVLVLHGSGERGNDNESQLVHGSDLFLQDAIRDKYPAIVVFPQCAANSSWATVDVTGDWGSRTFTFYEKAKPTADMLLLEGLLKYLDKTYSINKDKKYVGGLSMGGMGTFELVRRNPNLFAAAFPICGGANPQISKKIRKINWWVFHGDSDDVVPSKYSTQMVNALQKYGSDITYSLYPDVGHNSWENAFAEKELLPWLFSISK